MTSSSEKSFLLSVVTINLNNASGLSGTSVSLNELKNDSDVECILIDGASTDNSLDIAKLFWDEGKIVSEPDSGIYNAMNKGLSLASGKFILWLNSGDRMIPGQWPSAKQVLRETEADVISFGLEIYNANGNELLERRLPKLEMLPLRTLPHPSSIFKRQAVVDLGGYDESFRIAADRFLFIQLYKAGNIFNFPGIFLSKFYLGGISSNLFKTFFENREIDHFFNHRHAIPYSVTRFAKRIYLLIKT